METLEMPATAPAVIAPSSLGEVIDLTEIDSIEDCEPAEAVALEVIPPANECVPASEVTVNPPVADGPPEQAPLEETVLTATSTSAREKEDPRAEYERRLRDAEKEYCKTGLEVERAKNELKAAKERNKAALEWLEELKSQDPDLWGDGVRPVAAHPPTASPPHDNSVVCNPISPPQDGEWRDAQTTELDLGSIKGMGDKKLETILEQYPTIGSLEDKRAEGSGKGMGLQSIAGVGQKMADEIEDRILNWLTKNRDSHLFSDKSGETQPCPAEQPEATESEDSKSVPASDTLANTLTISDWPEDDRSWAAGYGDSGLNLIEARADWLKTHPLPAESRLQPQFESGRDAANRDWRVSECPYTPSIEMDCWLSGWLSARDIVRVVEEADWQKALSQCDAIISLCGELPEAGEDFGLSVLEKVEGIRQTIEERKYVTDAQSEALDNMETGVRNWLGE